MQLRQPDHQPRLARLTHRWEPELIERGRAFYAECKDTSIAPPTLLAAWVTAENVNDLVRGHGFAGELDLLSLDLDGNDYWIWRALDCVRPRVVVLEFNSECGPERSLSIRYDPDFRLDFSVEPYRCGASLPAFAKLGREKGYRLVGVQSLGINAFFVRDGLAEDLLPRSRRKNATSARSACERGDRPTSRCCSRG